MYTCEFNVSYFCADTMIPLRVPYLLVLTLTSELWGGTIPENVFWSTSNQITQRVSAIWFGTL